MNTFILKYYNTLSGCTWECEVNIKSYIVIYFQSFLDLFMLSHSHIKLSLELKG